MGKWQRSGGNEMEKEKKKEQVSGKGERKGKMGSLSVVEGQRQEVIIIIIYRYFRSCNWTYCRLQHV